MVTETSLIATLKHLNIKLLFRSVVIVALIERKQILQTVLKTTISKTEQIHQEVEKEKSQKT